MMPQSEANVQPKTARRPVCLNENGREIWIHAESLESAGVSPQNLLQTIQEGLHRKSPNVISTGRGSLWQIEAGTLGNLFVRKYRRGGFVRHFVRETYVRNPFAFSLGLRPFREFSALLYLWSQGIRVPEPIVAWVEPSYVMFYEGFLVTKEVIGAENYLDVLRKEKDAADTSLLERMSFNAGVEASRVVEAGRYHPDFHLGNVLVQEDGKVTLIDFDRCEEISGEPERSNARLLLIMRWQKSSRRHGLSHIVDDPFEKGLYGRHA